MTARRVVAIFLITTLAPIGARAAFNPEEEDPGQFTRVMDEKEKQEREAQYKLVKREEAQAEVTRRAAVEAGWRDRAESFLSEKSGIDWAKVNRWLFNLSMIGAIALLGWLGWKHNLPKAE
jgi:hypothetical protein